MKSDEIKSVSDYLGPSWLLFREEPNAETTISWIKKVDAKADLLIWISGTQLGLLMRRDVDRHPVYLGARRVRVSEYTFDCIIVRERGRKVADNVRELMSAAVQKAEDTLRIIIGNQI